MFKTFHTLLFKDCFFCLLPFTFHFSLTLMSVFGNGNLQRVHEREGESLRAYARRGGDVSPWNSSPYAMLILDASFSFFEGAARSAAWVIV